MPQVKGVKCDGCGATESFMPSGEQAAWAARPHGWSYNVQTGRWRCPSCSASE